MNWIDQRLSMRRQTCRSARGWVIGFLLLMLVLAPALDLAGDGRVASLPNSNGHGSDLCSVPGLVPSPLEISPVTPIARIPEAIAAMVPWRPSRPADHPPRSA